MPDFCCFPCTYYTTYGLLCLEIQGLFHYSVDIIYIRPLLQLCIRYDAQHVLLAHNHPSGNAAASRNDITATRQVEMALESIEATLNDHIIFAGEDTLSFAQCGWLGQIKEEVRDYRREELQAAREQEAAILWGDSLL